MAPEIIEGKEFNNKVDIWPLGIVIYELLTLKTNFFTSIEQIKNSKFCKIDEKRYNSEWQNLLDLLLNKNYEERPDINEVLEYLIKFKYKLNWKKNYSSNSLDRISYNILNRNNKISKINNNSFNEKENSNEKIEELQKRIKSLEIELENAKIYSEKLKKENDELRKENKYKSSIIDERKRKIEELDEKIIKIKNLGKIDSNSDKIITLMEKLENKEKEIKDFGGYISFNTPYISLNTPLYKFQYPKI